MRVLAKTGATVLARGVMSEAVTQLVILYGIESWVVTEEMINVLEGFHHCVSSHITGMTATCGVGVE